MAGLYLIRYSVPQNKEQDEIDEIREQDEIDSKLTCLLTYLVALTYLNLFQYRDQLTNKRSKAKTRSSEGKKTTIAKSKPRMESEAKR